MRTIKFRGKRPDGSWNYGRSIRFKQNGEVYIQGASVDPQTVGQFTGLRDFHGRDIYDGDIIKITGSNEAKHVAYSDKEAAFGIQYSDGDFFAFAFDISGISEDCYEVIGNIHDNPELLKGDIG